MFCSLKTWKTWSRFKYRVNQSLIRAFNWLGEKVDSLLTLILQSTQQVGKDFLVFVQVKKSNCLLARWSWSFAIQSEKKLTRPESKKNLTDFVKTVWNEFRLFIGFHSEFYSFFNLAVFFQTPLLTFLVKLFNGYCCRVGMYCMSLPMKKKVSEKFLFFGRKSINNTIWVSHFTIPFEIESCCNFIVMVVKHFSVNDKLFSRINF